MAHSEIHQVADNYVPRFRDTFLASIEQLRSQVTTEMVAEDMRAPDNPARLFALLDSMQIAKADVEQTAQLYAEIALNGAKVAIGEEELRRMLTLDSPKMQQAAREMAGTMIQQVTEESKQAVRQIITEAFAEGNPPAEAQKQIREVVGLTRRDAMAVNRLRETAPEKTVEQTSRKLLRRRALNIARTETGTASNRGLVMGWEEMADQGLLDRSRFRQRWLVTFDDRLCFPAGTLVATPSGDRPIEQIRTGDLVVTPAGIYPVTATMCHRHSGEWAYWESGDGAWSVATADHPVWTERGWVDAAMLRAGDMVDRGEQQRVEIVRVLRFRLGDMDDAPPLRHDLSIATRISNRIGVPIDAVNFEFARAPLAWAAPRLLGQRSSTACTGAMHQTPVYDLEVTGPACFYADGFLVHNCPRCAPMSGKVTRLSGSYTETERGVLPSARTPVAGVTVQTPPLHVNCRCVLVADFTE